MPWQRLWLRSYLWKFCSPSSYTCKFYLVPSRCGYAPGKTPTPPNPFLCWRPGTSLARVMESGAPWADDALHTPVAQSHVGQPRPPTLGLQDLQWSRE